VRATNTGISAIIAPTGEFLGTIGVHERASLVAAVPLEHGATTLMLVWVTAR
jgi:apolipoprotein N-acyltransferase